MRAAIPLLFLLLLVLAGSVAPFASVSAADTVTFDSANVWGFSSGSGTVTFSQALACSSLEYGDSYWKWSGATFPGETALTTFGLAVNTSCTVSRLNHNGYAELTFSASSGDYTNATVYFSGSVYQVDVTTGTNTEGIPSQQFYTSASDWALAATPAVYKASTELAVKVTHASDVTVKVYWVPATDTTNEHTGGVVWPVWPTQPVVIPGQSSNASSNTDTTQQEIPPEIRAAVTLILVTVAVAAALLVMRRGSRGIRGSTPGVVRAARRGASAHKPLLIAAAVVAFLGISLAVALTRGPLQGQQLEVSVQVRPPPQALALLLTVTAAAIVAVVVLLRGGGLRRIRGMARSARKTPRRSRR